MVSTDHPRPGSLAERLNRLFETVHPSGRGHFNNEEVARSIRENGGDISRAYIAYLRNGQRTNPTLHHLEELARFFGVKAAYFFDDDVADEVDARLDLIVAMRDAGVRSVALRAAGLSPQGLRAVANIVDQVRELEGLPSDDPAPELPIAAAESQPPRSASGSNGR